MRLDGIHCYTSFSFSYLSRATVLAETLRRSHPNWTVWALIVDLPPDGFPASEFLHAFDHVVYAKDMGFPAYESWIFKHDVVEACTAVKGEMMRMLLAGGAEKVVYLDPDIAVFHSLEGIISKLDDYSMILTPHQVTPSVGIDAIRDNEMTAFLYGIYNLGFAAVRADSNGKEFAQWWAERLYAACYDKIEAGIFTDQKYCDIVPALFGNVYIERDPGYNVASWNLSSRNLKIAEDGCIYVNDFLLKFYHFTKINSEGDIMTEKYARSNTEVFELWAWYKRAISARSIDSLPSRYWHYSSFSNGSPIKKAARIAYRESRALMEKFPTPFDASGPSSYYEFLNETSPSLIT